MKQTRWAWGKGHVQAPEAARSLVPSRAEENRFPPLPPRLFPQLPSCRSSNTSLAGLLSFLGSEISAAKLGDWRRSRQPRSEEHTSELQSLMRISYAVFCLKKKKNKQLS